jgi:hypothetical protein
MPKRLQAQDMKAIDLVLDKAKQTSAASFAEPDESVRSRVEPVQKVLNLLSLWPAEEPPADLVARTLARIAGDVPSQNVSPIKHIDPYGPLA